MPNKLRREPIDRPGIVRLSGVTKPVVQAVGATLPEVNCSRHDPITTPMRRQLDVVLASEAFAHFGQTRVQNTPCIDHFALMRHPGAKLATTRTPPEIGF